MKELLIAAAAAITALIGTPALAADMPLKAPPPAAVAVPSWTGWYVGVNAGYGWNADPVNVVGTPIFAANGTAANFAAGAIAGVTGGIPVNSNGFIGGGQFGYNKQFDRIVAGFELDIQGASIRGSGNSTTSVPIAGFPANTVASTLAVSNKLNYLGTVRADLGITFTPAVLVYVTGGLAYGAVNSNTTIGQVITGPGAATVNIPYGMSAGYSGTRAGWTAGGGLAFMLAGNWSAKFEYLYYDLGTVNYGGTLTNIVGPPGGFVPAGAPFYSLGAGSSTRFNGNIVRVGLNYKFAN